MRYVTIIVLALICSGCSACSSKEPQSESAAQPTNPTPSQLAPADDKMPKQLADAQPPAEEPIELDAMNVEAVNSFVEELRQKDPYREYFTVDGRLKDTSDANPLDGIRSVTSDNRYLAKMFDEMPTLAKRAFVPDAAVAISKYAVEYLHPELVRDYLTDLDWARDIAPIDPDWWMAMSDSWPDDVTEEVEIFRDADGKVVKTGFRLSKTDLWVRMFWKRRGEFIFNAMKNAVKHEAATATKKQ